MDAAEKVVIGLAVAVLGWLITSLVRFLIEKNRIESALIEDIVFHMAEARESRDYVKKLCEEYVIEGEPLQRAGRFSASSLTFYTSVSSALPKVLGRDKLRKVSKFYRALEEFSALMDGFLTDANEWKLEKRLLTADDVSFLRLKKDRIVALGDILCQPIIKSLDDLPDDYRGRMEATTIIAR